MTFTKIQVTHGYRELVGMVQLHSFYEQRVAKDLEFEPTGRSRELLRNFNMHFKAMPFGFILYYHNEFSPHILDNLPPKTKLSFYVFARDSKFSNYTEVPFAAENEAIYFSNLTEDSEELEEDLPPDVFYYFKNLSFGERQKYLLHSSNHSVVTLKGENFYHVYGENEKGDIRIPYNEVSLKDPFGEDTYGEKLFYKRGLGILRDRQIDVFLQRESKKLQNAGIIGDELGAKLDAKKAEIINQMESEPESGLQVDLRHVQQGKYTLEADKVDKLDFYTVPDPNMVIYGVIDIYLTREDGSSILKHYQGTEDRHFQPEMFLINFKARKTYWRFWFMNYPNSKVAPVEIFDEEGKLKFTEPIKSRLETLGKEAWVCESVEPIALQEKPPEILWLKRMQGKRPMKDFRLRVADPSMVKPYRQENGEYKIYSDVYVYL